MTKKKTCNSTLAIQKLKTCQNLPSQTIQPATSIKFKTTQLQFPITPGVSLHPLQKS